MARFFRRGVSKIYFLPAVASLAAPTSGEITAGLDLSPSLTTIAGLQFSNTPIKTPNLADSFTPEIPGEDAVAATKLTFDDDDTSTAIRTALAKGVAGFLVLMPYGHVSAKRAETWPATSTGCNDVYTTGNDSAKFEVDLAITARPVQNAVLP